MATDFRSDTVTRPTPGMRAAMAAAEVGDDVLGDDPTVIALEAEAAGMLGFEAGLFLPSARQEEIRHRRVLEEIIDFLEIQSLRNKTVGSLPYGMMKRVELGRALALEPSLLVLDEPFAGMNLEEKEDIAN